jgi:DNA-binding MarR family transcriptional regulator
MNDKSSATDTPDATTPLELPADLQAELKTQGCTNLHLRQLMRRVAQHYDLEMAKVGLKTTQYSLLSYVAKLGPLRPGELARGMKISASTLTRNLKPLVDAGWVELAAGSDARSRLVAIKPAGRAKREQALQHWKVAQLSLNQMLGAERVLALHRLINESLELLSHSETGVDDESS